MSKANKDGWIRHRGGKAPVSDDVFIDVRYRDGEILECQKFEKSEAYLWTHGGACGDIMAYRLHKPAEQDVIKDLDADISIASDGRQSATAKAIHEKAIACGLLEPAEQVTGTSCMTDLLKGDQKTVNVVITCGPLQWRDRIAEIDATTQALTTERAELVQKLAGEGFALIGLVVEPVEDMSDWRNWKVGDLVECISDPGSKGINVGRIYRITFVSDDSFGFLDDDGDHRDRGDMNRFKFHSRPSA